MLSYGLQFYKDEDVDEAKIECVLGYVGIGLLGVGRLVVVL